MVECLLKLTNCGVYSTHLIYKLLFCLFFLTAKLLERQIERERARKVDEVCKMED